MGGHASSYLEDFRCYLANERENKRPGAAHDDLSAWEMVHVKTPQQANRFDCGVFTAMFADHAARDAALDFGQADMDFFRQRITADIVLGSLGS
jgi:sentrin-specific protease 1